MNQADEANFRYPIESKRTAMTPKDQFISGSAKIETYSDAKAPPELNPYEMFPQSFHELIDIPIHVYQNGTTFNPHDKFKNTKLNPIITKGYANTNVNGNGKIRKNKVGNRIKPKRVSNRIKNSHSNPEDFFESKKISKQDEIINVKSDGAPKSSVRINKQPPIVQKKITGSRESDDYTRDKESEVISFQSIRNTKLKPVRPSLRFRATSQPNVTRNIYTTESFDIKKTTTTAPTYASKHELFDSSNINKESMSPLEPNIRTALENFRKERPMQHSKPHPLGVPEEMSEDLNPTLRFDMREEDESKKDNFVPSLFEGSRRESDKFQPKQENFDIYQPPGQDNFFNSDIEDNIRKQMPSITDQENNADSFVNLSGFEERPNTFEQSFKEPKPQKKKTTKFDFKPSIFDPYSNEQSFTPISTKKPDTEEIILATTFRPLHSLSIRRESQSTTTFKPPSNVFFSEQSDDRDSFFKPPSNNFPSEPSNDRNSYFKQPSNVYQSKPSDEIDSYFKPTSNMFPSEPSDDRNSYFKPPSNGYPSEPSDETNLHFKPTSNMFPSEPSDDRNSYFKPPSNMFLSEPSDDRNSYFKPPTAFAREPSYEKDSFYKPSSNVFPSEPSNEENAFFKPPSNVFLSEPTNERDSFFRPLQDIQEKRYDSPVFDENLPFTNSHSLTKPFRQYTIPGGPQERREPQLERGVPVYISSPMHQSVQDIQREFERYSQHPGLSSDLRPPPTQLQHEKSFNNHFSYDFNPSRRIFSEFDNGKEVNSNNKPSFFEKLGFFRPKQVNRNGLSPSKKSVFEPAAKNPHVEYVLSNGPGPVNGKKVVVVGPFKEPPIGAPVFIPESDGQSDGNEGLFQVPPPAINSVRKAKADEEKFSQNDNEFEKSRDFSLGDNNIFENNESRDIVVQSQFEVGDQNQVSANNRYKQGSVDSVNRFSASPGFSTNPKRTLRVRENNMQETNPLVRSAVQINERSYNHYDEVTEEDKNRLIAAKFKIPRIPSIRRSGLQRHMIPIPVPLTTSSGEQIIGFQNIQVPRSPAPKKTGRFLNTEFYNNFGTNIPESNTDNKPFKKHHTENIRKELETDIKSFPSSIIKAAHEADAFDKIINVGPPQSYQEPSVSDVSFGGWKAVGNSPIKSYVKESTPFIILKAFPENGQHQKSPEEILIEEIVEEEE